MSGLMNSPKGYVKKMHLKQKYVMEILCNIEVKKRKKAYLPENIISLTRKASRSPMIPKHRCIMA